MENSEIRICGIKISSSSSGDKKWSRYCFIEIEIHIRLANYSQTQQPFFLECTMIRVIVLLIPQLRLYAYTYINTSVLTKQSFSH